MLSNGPDITSETVAERVPVWTDSKGCALFPALVQMGCHSHGLEFLISDLHIFNSLK